MQAPVGAQTPKREQILTAAQKVFAQRGFHKATIESIAAQASIGKGTVYLYFRSKKELLAALIEERLAELVAGIRSAARRGTTGLDKLASMIEAHFLFYQEHKELVLLAHANLDDFATPLKKRIEAIRTEIDEIFREVFTASPDGVRRDIPMEIVAQSLKGMIHATALDWVIHEKEASPHVLASQIYRLFCEGAARELPRRS